MTERTSVRVRIVGEEYTVRSDAEPEHTRAVAAHVDGVISQIVAAGTVIESHKVAILAALQIADELLRLRTDASERDARVRGLAEEVARWLPPARRDGSAPG
ncbi:MAG TPA: cell division protein ZapA [Gemmatirosa sp.]